MALRFEFKLNLKAESDFNSLLFHLQYSTTIRNISILFEI